MLFLSLTSHLSLMFSISKIYVLHLIKLQQLPFARANSTTSRVRAGKGCSLTHYIARVK